ncbi:hypothetical protein CANARDRAFT_173795 [[Candida] arabinofermentans NRRL YB-2248]|uniref:Carboxypeptidase n=1 Tax=[Candida] arabinofermentans NRRL YB-2248 TaxID=983967 RepID=A0A1E4T841_9ASCO|nr:hypothetical protein CANARDRAFT_173795 [[Candida] arabinofermentans NRRL YB-2248]
MNLINALNSTDQESYKVKDLPGLSLIDDKYKPIMHAGQIEIYSENNTNLFFWKFEKPRGVVDKLNSSSSSSSTYLTDTLHKDELIIWLNGGPGCSSMDGALMEVGPLRINQNNEVYFNDGSWMEVADILFVDQPAGTGFSNTDHYDNELTQSSKDFIVFLKNYFDLFPLDKDKKIYIAGESYAGQYIPYIADYILQENSKDNEFNIDLKGLLIGNGWIEPNLQSLSYVPFALDNGLIDKKDDYMLKLLKQHEKCQIEMNDIKNEKFEKVQCTKLLDVLLRYTRDKTVDKDKQCLNMYDFRKHDSYPACGSNWPEDLPQVTSFLNIPIVQENLNLKFKKQWHECDNSVGAHFNPKLKISVHSFDLLPNLLKQIPIMLFSGDKDIICNYLSTEMVIDKLDINNGEQLGFSNNVNDKNWYYNDTQVGEFKNEFNLTYVKIYNSSHMVPFDLPDVSRGLLDIMMLNTRDSKDKLITPVYDIDEGTYHYDSIEEDKIQPLKPQQPQQSPSSSVKKHGLPFYFFELVLLAVLIYMFYYFYKIYSGTVGRSSFLTSSSRKKKRVHWFDESSTIEDEIVNKKTTSSSTSTSTSAIGSVLNKLGYGLKYNNVSNNEDGEIGESNRDIEMGNVDDQFLVQSDDEEYVGGGDNEFTQDGDDRL